MSRNGLPYSLSLREETALLLSRLRASKLNMPVDDVSEIVDLLAVASSIMRNTLNSHRPVNKVPDEILGHIFALVPSKLSAYMSDWFDSPVPDTDTLIPLTRVCRRWREVALSNQSLWTSISPTWRTIPMHTLFLKRSGTSLLACDAHAARDVEVNFWFALLEHHSSRIRRLQLDYGNTELFNALKELPMPELVEFVLGEPHASYIFQLSRRKREFCLFGGHAPRLQRLTLYGSVEGFPKNQFDTLTHLHLNEGRRGYIRGGDLATFLSRCPNLQHLIITTCTFKQAPRPAFLAGLRTLLIVSFGHPKNVTHIMSSFVLPSHAAVAISCMSMLETAGATRLGEFTVFPPSAPILVNFDICGSESDRMVMVAVTDEFSIHIDPIPRIGYENVQELESSCLPPTSVKELWVRIDSASEYDQLLALGRIFSFIETLVLLYEPPEDGTDISWETFATPIFPIHPGVSRVRICTWYGSIPSAMMGGLAARAQTGNRIAHLDIELPVWQDVRFTVAELEEYADVVEVVRTRSCTSMRVPDVYSNLPHLCWPEWHEKPNPRSVISWEHPVTQFR